MAKYTAADLVIEFDNSANTLVNMSQHVQTINGLDVEAVIEEAHTFGDSWVEQLFTGLKRAADVTLGGLYDDTAATGPNAIFNALGDTRTLRVTWGGTKTSSMETLIKQFKRTPARGELTKYEVTLAITGAITEA